MLWSSMDFSKIFKVAIDDMWFATGVSIDTRTLQAGDIFFAIKGQKFDGHDYIDKALELGAVAVVANWDYRVTKNPKIINIADSTTIGLNILAMAARKRCAGTIVGITGSVGKTTIKDMVGSVFMKDGNGFKSEANLNNTLGVPLNLVRMPATTKYAVIEAGMNRSGELTQIGRILQPDLGMITNIKPAHMANFQSIEQLAAAKYELMQHIKHGGTMILEAESEFLNQHADDFTKNNGGKIFTYGLIPDADFRLLSATDFENYQKIRIGYKGDAIEATINALGANNAKNIVAALAVCVSVGIKIKDALEVLSKWECLPGRGKVYHYKLGANKKIIIFDESYNSNPASLESSLMNLARYPVKGRKIAYLGDMLELGLYEKNYHAMIRDVVVREEIPNIVTVGPLMGHAMQTLPVGRLLASFDTAEEAVQNLPQLLTTDDIMMVKGSKAMHMNFIVEAICAALA